MKRVTLISIIGLILLSACSRKSNLEKVREEIVMEFQKVEGDFALAFKDLTTGEQLLINEKEAFHAASTMKTPVMIEVYKQAAEGKLSLTDSIEIKNEFKSIVDGSSFSLDVSDDSEADLYNQIGKKKTVSDLVYEMIIVSSNLATNLVIELVDPKNVTSTMRKLGAPDIQVLRGVEDQKAFEAGLSNTITAYDLMVIFEKIGTGTAVNPDADNEMLKVLLDQKFNEIIPAQLPTEVKVAHKTGSITGVQHDSGVIILPNGQKYVLITLSKNLKDKDAGVTAMANASKIIYDYANQHGK